MRILKGPARGAGRILVLALVVVGWQLAGAPAHAQLAANEAVFIDNSGTTCGVVRFSDGELSVVAEFPCEEYSEGIDVTSDGALAVIGNCFTNTLTMVDLLSDPPMVQNPIDSGVQCVQELDIAPDDSFGIATGSADGRVSKFTLDLSNVEEPIKVTGTTEPLVPGAFSGGSTQDVHISASGTEAVVPSYSADFLAVFDLLGDTPVLNNDKIIDTPLNPGWPAAPYDDVEYLYHQGISLSQGDNDTILATADDYYQLDRPWVTIASLNGDFKTDLIDMPGQPEAVAITCDGTRAVVETAAGLVWLNMTDSPPSIIQTDDGQDIFGPARTDTNSTSSVAFSADGSLLFVAGFLGWPTAWFGEEESQIDVYDATVDPPRLLDSLYPETVDPENGFPVGMKIMNVATLPCATAASEIEVAVDIIPRACPNRLNVRSRGTLWVAIPGTEEFEVLDIDPRTVQIEGASPLRWKLKDVTTPYNADTMRGDCRDCTRKGRDGFTDLMLKFRKRDIVKAIGSVKHADCLVLTLTGETFDGIPIVGDDVVRIIKRKPKKNCKKLFKKWYYSWLKALKKAKKGQSCTIEKKKTSLIKKIKSYKNCKDCNIKKEQKRYIKKIKYNWRRYDRRH